MACFGYVQKFDLTGENPPRESSEINDLAEVVLFIKIYMGSQSCFFSIGHIPLLGCEKKQNGFIFLL